MNNQQAFKQTLEIVRACDWDDRSKHSALENAYAQTVNGKVWRVLGFTDACINELRENDFKFDKVKPVRSHIFKRRDTFMEVINSDLDVDQAIQYIWDRDKAIMSLRSENKDDGSLVLDHPIDQTLDLFPSQTVGYRCSNKIEVQYMRENF